MVQFDKSSEISPYSMPGLPIHILIDILHELVPLYEKSAMADIDPK